VCHLCSIDAKTFLDTTLPARNSKALALSFVTHHSRQRLTVRSAAPLLLDVTLLSSSLLRLPAIREPCLNLAKLDATMCLAPLDATLSPATAAAASLLDSAIDCLQAERADLI
jgi:hypothetical protein